MAHDRGAVMAWLMIAVEMFGGDRRAADLEIGRGAAERGTDERTNAASGHVPTQFPLPAFLFSSPFLIDQTHYFCRRSCRVSSYIASDAPPSLPHRMRECRRLSQRRRPR